MCLTVCDVAQLLKLNPSNFELYKSNDHSNGIGERAFIHFLSNLINQIMKKVLSLLAFFSVIAIGSYAQGVSGGLKLGLNLANQTISAGSFTTSPSFRPSLHAGGYLTLMISSKLGVQPEVLYSGQGAKSGEYTLKLNYIAVPVLVRFNITDRFNIHAGPQIGILAAAKAKMGSESEDIKDEFKSTDIGIAAGLGVDLPMGLNFGFRFVKGMSNIAADSDDETKYKNYNLQFSVGYKLFGKK
jgi:hypothetical protein